MLPTLNPLRLTGPWLGRGAYRAAYQVADLPFIIKTPDGSWGDGTPGIRAEARSWVEVSNNPDISALFCPVLAVDDDAKWLIMPLCTPLADSDGFFADDEAQELFKETRGAAMPFCSDLHESNIMRLGDRAVVTDYGFGIDPRGRFEAPDWQEEYDNLSCGCCPSCGCDC